MPKTNQARQVLESKRTLVLSGVVGIVLAYSLFTRAVDTGSLFQYGLVILILILSIRLLIKAAQTKKDDRNN